MRFTLEQAMRQIALLIFVVVLTGATSAVASRFTLSGHVRDSASAEDLIGATVQVKGTSTGTSTNVYGFYSLTLEPGKYFIQYSHVACERREVMVALDSNIRMDIELPARSLTAGTVVVTADRVAENTRTTEMGTLSIDPVQIKAVPVLMGEQDLLKTMQLMPGVQEAGEGSSDFSVRGGGPDQNLILLDEATVYSSSHLLGFFSVFNSDAVKDAKLMKGSSSAEYGGRLSSVLDVRMKDGNAREFNGSGGIGLVASRLAVEGPFARDKGAFLITGRRTYFDLFLKASSKESIRKSRLYFYDLNAKANYRLGRDDRIFVSGYFGRDVLGYKDEFGIDWGNATCTARWNHIFSDRLFSNASLIYSRYNYKVGITNGDELVDIASSIEDITARGDFQYFFDTRHALKFGFATTYHTFVPGEINATQSSIHAMKIKEKYAEESALYASHEWTAGERLSFDYGLRLSSFALLGPGEVFTFDEAGDPTSVTEYGRRELIKHYLALEPRLSVRYLLDEISSLKASYARNRQYLHLLSASTTTTPFDLWHPSTKIVKPGVADQWAVGYFRNFSDGMYETSVEAYYKDLRNQVDYKNGADIYFNEYVESQLVFGKARAYGLELYAKKKQGRLTGWLGYTLAKAERKFDAIDNGRWYRARQDRTHDVEIVGIYELSRRWTVGLTWVYYTGNAVTFPSGKYIVDGHVAVLYSERNGYRMPAYHRLDISFTRQGKRSSWNFSLFNAYGRKNAYVIDFRTSETDPTQTEAWRTALFQFFPSVTYNFSF